MQQWGRPPGGRPPSVEDVLAKLQAQMRGWKIRPPIIIAAAAVLIVLATSWFTVQPQETGVVQRFGRVVRSATPGLHFKWPFGIESVQVVPTARVLKEEFGFRTTGVAPGARTRYAETAAHKTESLMLTGDLNVIDVQWIIQYRIENPIEFLFHVRDTPKTIRDISEAVMRRVVGNRLGSAVLTVDRVEVSTEAKEEIQKILSDYKTGVRLVTVELQDVTPPEKVRPAFNEVNEARQDKERTINQAQEQANRELPKARGVAQQAIQEAQGYALERVNRAQGEAARFMSILSEYQEAPEVTRRRMYLESMGDYLAALKGIYVVDEQQKAMIPWLTLDSGNRPTGEGGGPK
jgi:membrane protease subunit HflK